MPSFSPQHPFSAGRRQRLARRAFVAGVALAPFMVPAEVPGFRFQQPALANASVLSDQELADHLRRAAELMRLAAVSRAEEREALLAEARAALAAVLNEDADHPTALALWASLEQVAPPIPGMDSWQRSTSNDSPIMTIDLASESRGPSVERPSATRAAVSDDGSMRWESATSESAPASLEPAGTTDHYAELRSSRIDGAGAGEHFFGDPGADGASRPGSFDPALSAGTLTAGSLNDFEDPASYQALATKLRDEGFDLAARFVGENFALTVTDLQGRPIADALVVLTDDSNHHLATAVTRTDGRVGLLADLDGLKPAADGPSEAHILCTVAAPGATPMTTSLIPTEPATHQIRVPDAMPSAVETLDLVFVMDCTGSMGDELEYLKVELRSIVERIHESHPDVTQRYAMVCYRDTTDEYVTRETPFTEDLDAFIATLGAQRAQGGGDYPEAVNTAFRIAADMNYTPTGAARVALLIADAPPHDLLSSDFVDGCILLREQGVALYPVASSGVDEKTQVLFRSAAWMTGARYLFLTDHSGVGEAHAEPKASGYDVLPLNELLVRVIESELSGRPLVTDPESVIERIEP